ncbi:transient receptor potential cation channel subfamily M member-like 2 [Dreissena polymorpha]|uniref:transient receptor potential cation channel subfamily M member-like 2 n=1 Tax=Dreissena polymorpha TaxID=45954 RepID=UPI002264BA55|nr:transient receptor potential cation channel subfamily M member-like 2 [Dreissena polymorpha]
MWEKCNRQIGAALIASALLKKLSKIAKEETELELSKYTRQQSRQYEQKACDVLGKCFEENRSLAHKLLLTCLEKPFDSDDSTTIFDFAGANHLTTFMGHTCCQTKLSTIWRGQIAISTPWWKIVLLIFSPLFLPITLSAIKFRTLESPWTRRYIMGANSREGIATVKCNRCHKDTKPIKNDSSNISKNQDGQTKLQCEHCYKPLPNEDMLYRFSLCSGEIRFFDALFYLYTAPISAFWIHGVSYLFFLGLFSYFVVVDLEEKTTLKEWIIWGWIATFFFEELRQIANSKGRKLRKLLNWLRSGWNRFDLAMYIIFIITLCLRFTREGEDQFSSVRYFYSFTVAMFYIRFLQNFLVEKHIGLKVIMIEKMVFDLVVFLGIFLVFMQCFGIIYYANLYPNSPATVKLLQRIVYMPYWQIFGETYLEFLEGDEVGCTRNESIWRPAGGDRRCPEVKYWIPFIGGFYMLLTNVLLVNSVDCHVQVKCII